MELNILYGLVGILTGAALLTHLTQGSTASEWSYPARKKKKKKKQQEEKNLVTKDSPQFQD
jgi:hypothetical protein